MIGANKKCQEDISASQEAKMQVRGTVLSLFSLCLAGYATDCDILCRFFDATRGTKKKLTLRGMSACWTVRSGWKTGKRLGDWYRVTLDSADRVEKLILSSNGCTGGWVLYIQQAFLLGPYFYLVEGGWRHLLWRIVKNQPVASDSGTTRRKTVRHIEDTRHRDHY